MNLMNYQAARTVLTLVATGCLCLVGVPAIAQSSAGPAVPSVRMLPAYTVYEPDGTAVGLDAPRFGGMAMLVVDARLPSANGALLALNAKPGLRPDRLAIVVIGSSQDLATLRMANAKIGDTRWYLAPTAEVISQLRAPGVPLLLGIDGQGKIVWQRAGATLTPERLSHEVMAWQQRQSPRN
jgi:hypothetical protein